MINEYVEREIEGKTDVEILTTAFNERQNVLLVGDTGSGKTHLVRHVANKMKLPYFRASFDRGITVEDLIGEYKPDETNHHFKWVDGMLTKMVREGGVFVGDEINGTAPEILFFLNMLLDDERKVVLRQHNGEEIIAHKDFIFVATINPSDMVVYEGVKRMNIALVDRFDLILTINYSKEVEKKLIKNEKLLKLANELRTAFMGGRLNVPVSTRALLQYEANEKLYGKELAMISFINKFPSEEKSIVKEITNLHLGGNK